MAPEDVLKSGLWQKPAEGFNRLSVCLVKKAHSRQQDHKGRTTMPPQCQLSKSEQKGGSHQVMSKRKRSNESGYTQERPTWTLTRDGVRTMVTGAPFSEPLVLRLENIQPQASTTAAQNNFSYASAVICDDQHVPWSKEVYVCNTDYKGRPLFRLVDPSISYIVSVDGYVTSQTNTSDTFLCLTSLKILSEEKKETLSRLRIPLKLKERTSGGVAANFLLDRAPLFSDAQLAGSDAFRSAWADNDNDDAVLDKRKAGKDFCLHHSAMKTLHESSTTKTTEHAAQNYMSAVREFAVAQLDRQKASLTTNAGHEAADRATLVTNQHRIALEAALAHADDDLTVDALQQWHGLLCGGGLAPDAGRLRTRKNRAGNTDFLPAERVPLELEKFCRAVRALGSRLLLPDNNNGAAATFAAAVCFGVLDIHAFADGNGRLSRVSTNWALRRAGLPFVINLFATPAQRREYVVAIEMTRRNLSIVARGNVDEETLLNVTAHSGLLQPLERLITDQIYRAAAECSKLVTEKSLLVSEEQEARAARRFRETAAAGTCLICFDNFPNVATLCCGKAVHLNCMAKWLSDNESCPQCRADLPSLPPRLAAPAENQDTTEAEAEGDFGDDTTTDIINDSTEETVTVVEEEEDTTDVGATTEEHTADDETTDDTTTEEVPPNVSPPPPPPPATTRRALLPQCVHCRNRSAADCSNACCGRCCVIHGHFQCARHNMVS